MDTPACSRFLCRILRHEPSLIGITVDPHGWADVDELLAGVRPHFPLDREGLASIVAADKKHRYSFSADGRRIRCNQGHSIPVDLELLPVTPPDTLWHGSASDVLSAILSEGLKPMERHHVHLSPDPGTAMTVGGRHAHKRSCGIVLFRIDSKKMHTDGFLFYRSENGVWLTDAVPPSYLEPIGSSGGRSVSE